MDDDINWGNWIIFGSIVFLIFAIFFNWGNRTAYSSTATAQDYYWYRAVILQEEDCISIISTDSNGYPTYSESCDWDEIKRISREGNETTPPIFPSERELLGHRGGKKRDDERIIEQENYEFYFDLQEPKYSNHHVLKFEASFNDYVRAVECPSQKFEVEINHFGNVKRNFECL